MIGKILNYIRNFARRTLAISMWSFLSSRKKAIVVIGTIISAITSFAKILAPAALSRSIQMVANSTTIGIQAETILIGIAFTPKMLMYSYVGLEFAIYFLEITSKRITSATELSIPKLLQEKLLTKARSLSYREYEKNIDKIRATVMEVDNGCSSMVSAFSRQTIPCLFDVALGSFMVANDYKFEYGFFFATYWIIDGLIKNLIASCISKESFYDAELMQASQKFYNNMFDLLMNAETIRLMNHTEFENDHLITLSKKYHAARIALTNRQLLTNTLSYLVPATLRFLIIFYFVHDNFAETQIDTAIFLMLYLNKIEASIDSFSEGYKILDKAERTLADVTTLLNLPNEGDLPAPLPLISEEKTAMTLVDKKRNGIVFDRVDFTFNENKEGTFILKQASFSVASGETMGLIGKSGIGKSTLTKLISRLYEPTSGHIYLNGKNIQRMAIEELRANLAILPQEIAIFRNETYLYNVMYGIEDESLLEKIRNNTLSDAELEMVKTKYQRCMRCVGLASKISSMLLPCIGLSTGEKQRIGIARLLLKKKASLFILDEPTSAMDPLTEGEISHLINQLTQNKAAIVIAHRLTTIKNANRICSLNDGKLTEEAHSHNERIKQRGLYATFWNATKGKKFDDSKLVTVDSFSNDTIPVEMTANAVNSSDSSIHDVASQPLLADAPGINMAVFNPVPPATLKSFI